MMDVVLGGGMGFVLAVLLSNPPRQNMKVVTAKVVEDAPPVATKPGAKAAAKGKKK